MAKVRHNRDPDKPDHDIHLAAQNCVPASHQAHFNTWYQNTIGEPDLRLTIKLPLA